MCDQPKIANANSWIGLAVVKRAQVLNSEGVCQNEGAKRATVLLVDLRASDVSEGAV